MRIPRDQPTFHRALSIPSLSCRLSGSRTLQVVTGQKDFKVIQFFFFAKTWGCQSKLTRMNLARGHFLISTSVMCGIFHPTQSERFENGEFYSLLQAIERFEQTSASARPLACRGARMNTSCNSNGLFFFCKAFWKGDFAFEKDLKFQRTFLGGLLDHPTNEVKM